MYNSHRGMASNARAHELLEQMRAEFDQQDVRAREYEHQINNQIQEMDMIRNKVYQMEQNQQGIKAKYEEEISRLRRELEARGGPAQSHMGGVGGSLPPQPAPSIGHGPSNLFGNIMAGQGGQGGPSLAPPPPMPEPQQAPPPHQIPQPPPIHQQGPSQPPAYPSYGQQPVNGYGAQGPPQTQSPGPGNRNPPRGPPGPPTPQQTQVAPYEPRASPAVARPSPGPPSVGNNLADLDPALLQPHQKKEGPDWFAVFNPRLPRTLDVDLVHTLDHNSVVCCVRFSADGKYVATGCNHSAQIFEVNTGRKVVVLKDESVEQEGDLYIRSVCFSPDGRYLATGAEDKQIRVWDITSQKIVHLFSGHDQDIYSLDFARNGRIIASGSGDRTVRIWDMETGACNLTLHIEDGVTTVAISPDGRYVAAGSLDKSVRVWELSSGILVERLEGLEGHMDSVYSVAFAPTGRELVSGSLDKTIKMWELNSKNRPQGARGGKCIRTFEGHKDFVLSVALTTDGRYVLSGSKDRGVMFWEPSTGNVQLMLQGHKNSVISVAPSPMGKLFATGSGDMRARIWRYDPIV